MKVKVINSSSIKTRNKIKSAFAILMQEKRSLNKITVTDLVAKADITRSSFYTHYGNIYDVAKEFHDEMLNVLIANIDKLKSAESINNHFDEIFTYLKDNEEVYSMILSSDDPLLFTDQLSKIIFKTLKNSINYQNHKNLELNITFFIDGCISLVIRYFRHEINYSLDDINNSVKNYFKTLFL